MSLTNDDPKNMQLLDNSMKKQFTKYYYRFTVVKQTPLCLVYSHVAPFPLSLKTKTTHCL